MHLIPDVIRDANNRVKQHLMNVGVVQDQQRCVMLLDLFVDEQVTECIARALRHSLAKSIDFCEKACREALPALLGSDVSEAVLKQAIVIAQRDSTEKCAGMSH